jgi:hypothetical protein
MSHFMSPPHKALIDNICFTQLILIPVNTELLILDGFGQADSKLPFLDKFEDPQAHQISPDKDFNFLCTGAPFTLPDVSQVFVKSW